MSFPGLVQPSKYAVDRATALNDAGDRLECVVLILVVGNIEHRFVMPKEDAILLGSALAEAAHDAKRIIDVLRGVG